MTETADSAEKEAANRALLVGMIAGQLSLKFDVDLERDKKGNYTGRIFVQRLSGRYVLTVAGPS